MGCVSSSLLHHDDDFPQIGSTAFSHHFVSLTSTTYGLLSLEPPPSPMTPPTPPPRFTLASPEPEVINSWELMAGLDSNPNPNPNKKPNDIDGIGSFRFSPLPPPVPLSSPKFFPKRIPKDSENLDPNIGLKSTTFRLEDFPKVCPRDGEDKVVLYTTSLRGVRKTFEACNAVRSAIQLLGFSFCERDISMDRGFRDELKPLLIPAKPEILLPPHLFIKGRYIGSAEEVLRIHEEGGLQVLLKGLPKVQVGTVCDGCGDVRFLPCFRCSGSCKLVSVQKETSVVTRCPDCNENGLVLCPICS